MKRIALLTGMMLVLMVATAFAGGINMSWNDCGVAGVANKAFACDTNTGNHDIFTSFDPPQAAAQIHESDQIVDLQAAGGILPDWWQFKNAGSCRAFEMSTPSVYPASCFNTWGGNDSPGFAAYLVTANTPSMPPDRARIMASVFIPGATAVAVTPGTEYYAMTMRIRSGKTVGAGSCAGCQVAVCLVLSNITLHDVNGDLFSIGNPLSRNFITWQGGAVGGGCPGATPAINQTWGRVKAIYR
ncbi:MAG TPA: hypothetical protein VJY35_11770 [Candidatus Eisenbacteria bacterium]|nr:hypothetical protein [Candidatus Eisenbacteria bacterium]